jgi:hypothetical protein
MSIPICNNSIPLAQSNIAPAENVNNATSNGGFPNQAVIDHLYRPKRPIDFT